MSKFEIKNIVVVGLGYVGLPLAVVLAKHYNVIGFDINNSRVAELLKGFDRTGEIDEARLRSSSLKITSDLGEIEDASVYIVTVPTPITANNLPDLSPLRSASTTVGQVIKKNAIVVYESTVYPGVTEDICAPILEEISGLTSGKDFFLGYSPERINPGDKVHTVDKITKVVAGQNEEVAKVLAEIYGSMNDNNIHIAANIKTAEAAKVIENAQRDINIAFVNEITTIFNKMDISIYDVLDAANTKWNFLPFQPGMVGGHCIGVDPYYLAYAARQHSYEPAVILSGRRINENMSMMIATAVHNHLKDDTPAHKKRILILGLTFKENVPDLRNTKVTDMIDSLMNYGYKIDVHDPMAIASEAKEFFNIDMLSSLDGLTDYDAIIGAVGHDGYRDFSSEIFATLLKKDGLVADIKQIWKDAEIPSKVRYWSL